ncbi:MAG: calcium/sodium antiporter [Pseudomonadota bacterium]
MITFFQVAGGLLLLFFGGEFLVRAAVSLARRIGVSPLVIGLSVVAAGTSAPEMVVCLIAALEGAPGIAIGNVVGSNIANLLLVVGAAGMIYPIARNARSIYRDGAVCIAATVLFVFLSTTGEFESWHGIVMLVALAAYLLGSYWSDRRDAKTAFEIEKEVEELEDKGQPLPVILLRLAFGFTGVILGSELLVDGSIDVARSLGLSETVIGVTLVAVGTSLPELATSIIAAKSRHTDVALGNAIGSCIFNLLAIMGVVAAVVPIKVPVQILIFDIWVLLGVTAGFMVMGLVLPRMGKRVSLAFLILYGLYAGAQFSGFSAMPSLVH